MVTQNLNKQQNLGIYVRVSRDDGRDTDSISVENQKDFLVEYAESKNFNIYDIYVDDGLSGLSFDRPSLNRLVKDIDNGFVNIILIKDLSRLGRNQTSFTKFVDEYLPSRNCRLIAPNDYIDTFNGYDDIMPLRSLFNELYSKDLSVKVRTSKIKSANDGKFMGGKPPYGYRKNPLDSCKLEIDENISQNVVRIYEMRLQGMGRNKIAGVLNSENILPPLDYYYQSINKENPYKTNHSWNGSSIQTILNNEVYIGSIVSLKSQKPSYKNNKRIKKSKDDWHRVLNVHETIISNELWESVQEIENNIYETFSKNRIKIDKKPLFMGVLKCGNCGFGFNASITRHKRKNGTIPHKISYICRTYEQSGRTKCSANIIYEEKLLQIVKEDLKIKLKDLEISKKRVLAKIEKVLSTQNADSLEKQKVILKHDIEILEKNIALIYEKKALGKISKIMYDEKFKSIDNEIKAKNDKIEQIDDSLKVVKSIDYTEIENTINEFLSLEKVDRTVIRNLIEKIEVFEKQTIDEEEVQKINIYYKFDNNIQ